MLHFQGKSERKKAEGEMDDRRQAITAEQITARLRANRRVEEVEAGGGVGGGDRLLEELYRGCEAPGDCSNPRKHVNTAVPEERSFQSQDGTEDTPNRKVF